MFWLIEDLEKVDQFCKINHKEVYVEVIPSSPTLHPIQNRICALYLRPLEDTKGYIIPIKHSETINFPNDILQKVISSIGKIYVRDKKEFLHYLIHKQVYQPTPHPPTYIPEPTMASKHLRKLYAECTHVNVLVPIVKHYEVCSENFNNFEIGNPNLFYNNKAAIVFNKLEQSGIKINQKQFERYFDRDEGEYVYTKYNLNTTTTRPSNTFGGINFSALNKDNGERKCFIPRNDLFYEMDISAYHPTLLANSLHYSFDSDDVHGSFAKMYKVDYKKAKEITFKQIYGGIWKQYEELEFFKKVKVYTDKLWHSFENEGYVECSISGYKFEKSKMDNMNPQKLLNYVLQNLETANNVLILWDIFKILRGKNTKLVLYVYDSFLFDVDESETEVLEEINNIFKKFKLNTKSKKGKNYNFQ